MNKVLVDIQNCYGIKKLQQQFDFTQKRVYAIYAPNGAMKSSFAQTFKDVGEGKASRDRIFPARTSAKIITDEAGIALQPSQVLVIAPYDQVFGHTEKTSTLLVNAALRQEYEQLHLEIDKAEDRLLKALRQQSHSKRDIAKEISATFTKSEEEFHKGLIRVKDELLAQKDAPFADVEYDVIFDEKVQGFLGTKDFKTAIEDYVRKYNELLAASTYFKKGTFTYYHAGTIAKNLADNGFFDAKHSVNLNADTRIEITTQKQLEDLIVKEKEGITNDQILRKKYEEIDKLLKKNVTVRDFETYLAEHEALLPKLANVEEFKEELWKSYLKANIDLYQDLLDKIQAAAKRKEEIEQEAGKERTQWQEVIEIFNQRFFVPFKLVAQNRISVILGSDPMLRLGFTFEDGTETTTVERTTLLDALSTGEKKALYVLNIIFEIEARRKASQETVIVVEDIADSFDYKNKYAIIHYLKEIAEETFFKQIILTHNFDFFRTVHSRFVGYSQCLMAMKTDTGVVLDRATGIKNVFVNDWKINFFKDPKKRIACIPFIRNIIEYTKGDADQDYVRLTSLLHWRADSAAFTNGDLDSIYNGAFHETGASPDPVKSLVVGIFEQADSCISAAQSINFENKIVLSIATRLLAERFMITKINDAVFVAGIDSNQTPKLLSKYKKTFPAETLSANVIERVLLMTPENIHLNSFMYEPILDMSDDHLRKLYADVKDLI
jgi:hypothetical protein